MTIFCINGTFWLTPMFFMNEFDEDMKINFSAVLASEANRDSIENSVPSQIEDRGTRT